MAATKNLLLLLSLLLGLLDTLQSTTATGGPTFTLAQKTLKTRSTEETQQPNRTNLVAAGFLFADRSDARLNLSDSIDANLSRILDRNGPDMRPSRDFKDFSDITLDVSKRAWSLLHDHTKLAIQERLDLAQPAFDELLESANVSQPCHRAIHEVFDGAKRMDSWAVKLLNSWANFPTVGLFEGTYSEVGSFHSCVNIKQNFYIDHAHYCSITFRPVMPSRKNYELVIRKEPEKLLNLFEQMRKINQTDQVNLVDKNENDELFKKLFNKTGPNRDAFSDILEHAQYHHYVYYKIGTCWPIQCSPFDIRRVAKLAARRMLLMNGPVKCYSRYEDDYEEAGSVELDVTNTSTTVGNQTSATGPKRKKLIISIWDKNDGIFIWKPHFYTAHKVALGVIAAASAFILLMTVVDILVNRIPQLVDLYWQATNQQYTMASGIDVRSPEVGEPTDLDDSNGRTKFCLKTTSATQTGRDGQKQANLSHIEAQVTTTHFRLEKHPATRKELSIWMTIVDDCSIITNTKQFFTITEAQMKQIRCLDGIRCITMVWIIMTHTMMYNDWSAFARTREVENAVTSLVGQPFFNGSYLVDTFFLLSGLLSAYTAFRHCKGLAEKFNGFAYIFSRWLRLTPQIFFCSMIYIVLPAVSYGPHWFPIVGEYSENCVDNWWVNVLHLQAFYKTEKMCNFVTWWISIDFLYHFFALACIWIILYAGHKLGFLGLVLLVGGQVGWQAIKHYQMILPPNVMSTIPQTGAMWTEMTLSFFWKPYAHSVPFFFGFYIGYLMALKRKLIVRQLDAQRALIGWLLSSVLFVGQSYSTYWWVRGEFDYPRLLSTLFQVVCPIIWAGTLCWTILACQHGFGGFINEFLSARVFIILGKASYMVYLSHFQVLFIYFGNQSLLMEPSELVMFYMILGNIFLSTIYGIILCVIFELPWLKFQKKLMKYV